MGGVRVKRKRSMGGLRHFLSGWERQVADLLRRWSSTALERRQQRAFLSRFGRQDHVGIGCQWTDLRCWDSRRAVSSKSASAGGDVGAGGVRRLEGRAAVSDQHTAEESRGAA